MRILLDTHTLIWFANGDMNKLSKRVQSHLDDGENELFVSICSFWEIAIKTSVKKLSVTRDLVDLEKFLKQLGIPILPITVSHTIEVQNLDLYHRDPFDRLLIAKSIIEDFSIATKDPNFSLYPIKTIW
jgi:PIN domain nuclease of toxin-antitoxin system